MDLRIVVIIGFHFVDQRLGPSLSLLAALAALQRYVIDNNLVERREGIEALLDVIYPRLKGLVCTSCTSFSRPLVDPACSLALSLYIPSSIPAQRGFTSRYNRT
jgi:hypothetical protein